MSSEGVLDKDSFTKLTSIMNSVIVLNEMSTNSISAYRQQRRLRVARINNLRRKQKLILLSASSASLRHERIVWNMGRATIFWEYECQNYNNETFTDKFCMSRESFDNLCVLLKDLGKRDTQMRKAIPIDKRIAVALYTLGSTEKYRRIGELFGIGRSTVWRILLEFCSHACKILMPKYLVKFPLKSEKIIKCVQGFEKMGFPQCVGVIDCCHIEITPSINEADEYRNSEGYHSIILLALIDSSSRFMFLDVNNAGSCDESEVYGNAVLKKMLEDCEGLDHLSKVINNVNIPIYFMGNKYNKLTPNVMIPYESKNLEAYQKNFNVAVSNCKKISECTFASVQARFRRLSGLNNGAEHSKKIIKACCVLHNFLNTNKDSILPKWLHVKKSRKQRPHVEEPVMCNNVNVAADKIRHALATYLDTFDIESVGGENFKDIGEN